MKQNLKDISVLIVDDNQINQKVLSFNMLRYELKTFFADNGLVAVEKYREHPYELILMDLSMPVMDGLEATQTIRIFEKSNNLNPSVIIAISANYVEENREKYLTSGLDEIIQKPVDFNFFNRVLSKYFEI